MLRSSSPSSSLVSVVIPSKNRRERVLRTIASVQAQEDVEVEVVLVDDGSTDGTADAVRALGDVVVVRHETSQGVAAARNAGVAAGSGEWVAFLDDDDLWAPDKLRCQLAAAAAAGAGWAYAGALIVDERGTIVQREPAPPPEQVAVDLLKYNPIPAGSSNVLVRRELFDRAGGFDTALHHLADWDLWARLTALELPAAAPELVVGYVRHVTSMRVADIRTAEAEIHVLDRKLRASLGEPLNWYIMPGWLAEGHTRAGQHWRAAAILLPAAVRFRSRGYLRSTLAEVARGLGLAPKRAEGDEGPAPAWARADHAPAPSA